MEQARREPPGPLPGRGSAWALPLLAALAAGCVPDRPRPLRPEQDLHDPSATRRVQAVAEVGRRRSLDRVATLIEMLDDDDAVVRLMAGSTLTGLTGRDTGYLPHADPAERRRQRDDWRAWWASEAGRARAEALAPPAPVGRP